MNKSTILLLGLFAATAVASAQRTVLATGSLVVGATTHPNAVVTYNAALDASGLGSNTGIEVWASAAHAALGINRIARSNGNNGQWSYRPQGAFFLNGTVTVYGTRTGSHGPLGSTWTYVNHPFLRTENVAWSNGTTTGNGVTGFGPFTVRKGTTLYSEAYVTYDAILDASGFGSNLGINVWSNADSYNQKRLNPFPAPQPAGQLWRTNGNNGAHDIRGFTVFNFNERIYIVGEFRSGGTWHPTVWQSDPNSSFILIQGAGLP